MKFFYSFLLSSSILTSVSVGCGSSNLNSSIQSTPAGEVESEQDSTALIAQSPQEAVRKNSQEFRRRVQFVEINYQICLGRTADSAGLIQWVNLIATKRASLEKVQSKICSSLEAKLTQTYRVVLARNPDAGGRRYWLSALSNGQVSIAQVRQSLLESPEIRVINYSARSRILQAQLAQLDRQRKAIVAALAGS